ncbi:MAG: penicillin-binding protein 1C [Limisphaerales bacterium]
MIHNKTIFLKWSRNIAKSFLSIVILFFLLNIIFPYNFSIPWSTVITDRDGEVLHAYLSEDEKWRIFTPIDQISPDLEKAFIHKEDRLFYYHPGFNPIAVFRAFKNNTIQGTRTSGASTIHMQVVRLLNPKPRTYPNKIIEIFRALQLNLLYSKKEVLQLYLNLVPYGGNIEGVSAASLLYLDKTPEQLSRAEITVLTIIPNRPGSLRPGKKNEALLKARDKWLNRFYKEGLFDATELELALTEPFNPVRRNAPQLAPHLARRLKNEFPNQAIIISTLNYGMQVTCEQMVKNYMPSINPYGINNAAVLVVDNNTAEVLAYLGSADFYDTKDGGQVDGLRAIRSPGSTLKPILFGLAMDSGLITPKSILLDVPIDFAGYSPRNFDRTCRGLISAENAMALSLNIPSVSLLDEFGVESFRKKLANTGTASMQKQKGKLGLSMILGGCGIRAEEIVSIYAGIANDGLFRPLKINLNYDTLNKDTIRILSDAAAWAVGDLLTGLSRPDFPTGLELTQDIPKVAWKTGTSYGRRDAWSVGFNSKYTVLVWTGNFSGKGVPELTGSGIAAPLLFDLFQALDRKTGKAWTTAPSSLEYRYVCSQSGLIPDTFCHDQVLDVFMPLISSAKKCTHLQETFIKADSSFTYCKSCLPESGYRRIMWPTYSPSLLSWYNQQQIGYEILPAHNPDCERVFSGDAPQIISPVSGLIYYVYPGSGKVALQCEAEAGVNEVYWYVGDRFLGASSPAEALYFDPQPGRTKISCTDDKGRNRDTWIEAAIF